MSKNYTPSDLEQITGQPASNFTTMWMNSKLPHAFLSPDKVLMIPEEDALLIPGFKLPAAKVEAPDFSKIKQEADNYANKIRSDADACALETRNAANIYSQNAKDIAIKTMDEANQYYETKIKEADEEQEAKALTLQNKIAVLNTQYATLQDKVDNCLRTYNKIISNTRYIRKYQYNLAQSDKLGRFLAWCNNLMNQ